MVTHTAAASRVQCTVLRKGSLRPGKNQGNHSHLTTHCLIFLLPPYTLLPPPSLPPANQKPPDGGFRRQLPCPPDVTFCVTASVLPPLNLNDMVRALLEGSTIRALARAITTTMGSSPFQFFTQVIMQNRVADYKLDEVVYGAVSYVTAVNPGKHVHIYPGEQRGRAVA